MNNKLKPQAFSVEDQTELLTGMDKLEEAVQKIISVKYSLQNQLAEARKINDKMLHALEYMYATIRDSRMRDTLSAKGVNLEYMEKAIIAAGGKCD